MFYKCDTIHKKMSLFLNKTTRYFSENLYLCIKKNLFHISRIYLHVTYNIYAIL